MPAASVAVSDAPFAPAARASEIDHVPSSFTVASKGPERTLAPFSTVPLISTIFESMVSPSSGEVILNDGGVVSAGALWAAAVGAGVSSSTVTGVSSASAVSLRVVAVLVPGSTTRIARTAEATRADIGVEMVRLSPASVVEAVSDDPLEGENAAKPTTAMRAMTSKLAYAMGTRGLTRLRGFVVRFFIQTRFVQGHRVRQVTPPAWWMSLLWSGYIHRLNTAS